MSRSLAVGVDVGGTGIKGAVVALDSGELASERVRLLTPSPATPDGVAGVVAQVVSQVVATVTPEPPALPAGLPVGVGVPTVVMHGITQTAANIDDAWVGAAAADTISHAVGAPCVLVNDADAAGLAEARFGAARGVRGVVLVLTLGTGIGSALIVDGTLVPNTELGHLELDGHVAEHRASDGAREREELSWQAWAERLQRYLAHVEALFWPDLVVLGGGASKRHERFLPHLELRSPVVPAGLRNQAGIVGAAVVAAEGHVAAALAAGPMAGSPPAVVPGVSAPDAEAPSTSALGPGAGAQGAGG